MVIKIFSSVVLLLYLLLVSVIIIVDAVGTVTFRWREYGELTHRHTDATSIIFLLGDSRWALRLLASLTVASAASLQTTKVEITQHSLQHPPLNHRTSSTSTRNPSRYDSPSRLLLLLT